MKKTIKISIKAEKTLIQLAENLKLARKRRKMSQALLASKIQVSRSSLARLESGDPGVSLGLYLEYLNQLDLLEGLEIATNINTDVTALESEIKSLRSKGITKAKIPKDFDLDF